MSGAGSTSDFLSDVKVVESAVLLNGDTVGMLLGDLGADVIKVESPGRGDYIRDFLGQITPHHSPAHLQVNRNKRSITIDLRTEQGRDVFWRLVSDADVFVDGGMPGSLDRLGLGWAAQSARNPGLIYCQYTGFGASGPYASIPTHGMMMNALVGATPVELDADDHMRAKRVRGLGGTERGGDGTTAGAVQAVMHVLAALLRRARTGQGCYLDVAASDAVVLAAVNAVTVALNRHRLTDTSSLPTIDGADWTGARYQYYETRDGRALLFAAIEPKFWARFCAAVGWADTPRAAGHGAGTAGDVDFGDDDDLRDRMQAMFRTRDHDDWIALAAEVGIPIGPAPGDIMAASADAHLRGREILVEGTHPEAGAFTYVGRAAVIPSSPFTVRRGAPALGEHTREVLLELGYDDETIAALSHDGVI